MFVMATLTQTKRDRFTARYAKKDARTLIYRALYGEPERHDRGDPTTNSTRKLPQDFSWQAAKRVWEDFEELAAFPKTTHDTLTRRLEVLRHYKKGKDIAQVFDDVEGLLS